MLVSARGGVLRHDFNTVHLIRAQPSEHQSIPCILFFPLTALSQCLSILERLHLGFSPCPHHLGLHLNFPLTPPRFDIATFERTNAPSLSSRLCFCGLNWEGNVEVLAEMDSDSDWDPDADEGDFNFMWEGDEEDEGDEGEGAFVNIDMNMLRRLMNVAGGGDDSDFLGEFGNFLRGLNIQTPTDEEVAAAVAGSEDEEDEENEG